MLGIRHQLDSILWNPSVRPSLNFLKIGSLVFSDIYMLISYMFTLVFSDWRSQIFYKKVGGLNFGSMGLSQAQSEVFPHSLEFGWYVFLGIAYNDSLLQCLTSSRSKIYTKKLWGPNLDQMGQIGPKSCFFIIFSSHVR